MDGVNNSPRTKENLQKFLDEQQYSKEGVCRYQWIFGETFISTGGKDSVQQLMNMLDLKPGEKVLDVGSGIGGHAFHMAENYGVYVHGIDLSVNMMSVALEHLSKKPHIISRIHFEIADATKANFDENSFDVIYSRDSFLHIADKAILFKNFLKWLKPNGRILFTDYCRGNKEHAEDFKDYVSKRCYHLLTVNEYGQLLRNTGFTQVKAVDQTEDFVKYLKMELSKLRAKKDDFLEKFSKEDFNYLEEGWLAKIHRATDGDQTWCLCYAVKS